MQRIRRWYMPVITTLTFLAVASLVAYFLVTLINWRIAASECPPLTVSGEQPWTVDFRRVVGPGDYEPF